MSRGITADLPGQARLVGQREPARLNGIERQAAELTHGRAEAIGQRHKVGIHIAAKVGGIVRVDGDAEPLLQQPQHIVLGHIAEHLEPGVGEGADGERQPGIREIAQQLGIVCRTHSVIDTAYLKLVDRLPDVVGRPLFTRVGHHRQPQLAAFGKDLGKFSGRVAPLPGVKADAVNA